MYQRILVPLDGSSRAESAIPIATRLARASGGVVILTQAVMYPYQYDPVIAPLIVTSEYMQRLQDDAREYLTQVAREVRLAGGATQIAVEIGQPDSVITEVAARDYADVIVMTSHGRTGFARWALGSVAQRIATHAPAPTLVVQGLAGQPRAFPPTDRPVRGLVPLDGSAVAERALEPTAALVAALSAPDGGFIHLMQALPAEEMSTPQAEHSVLSESVTGYLARLAAETHSKRPTLHVSWSVESDADIASAILRVAERGVTGASATGGLRGFDLIGMATHGRTGVARWALGSVTDRVLHTIRQPIFVVPPSSVAPD